MADTNNHERLMSFEELSALADEGKLTRESLQGQLDAHSRALREEFELSTKETPETDNLEKFTKDFFKSHLHSAAAQIVHLANNADSETVRLSSSKYIIEAALVQNEEDANPLAALLKDLVKNDPVPVGNEDAGKPTN